MIKMLICVHSLFQLTIITSVFLLFNYNPFLLLSSSRMSKNCCKFFFLFCAIHTVSAAYLNLLKMCPPTLILRYPSRFRMIISSQREKRLEERTHPCLIPRFFNELIFPSTLIAAVCCQYMFSLSLADPFQLS